MRHAKVAALLLPLAPLLLSGCGSSSSTTATATPSTTGSPWIVSYTGSPSAATTPTLSYSSPTPFATGFLPITTTSASPTPTTSNNCDGADFHPGAINGVTVVPGATSATVSWYNPGGDNLVEYRVTAISQGLQTGEQRDVGWTVVTPGTGCSTLTAPLTGLDRKTYYVFSVDAVYKRIGVDGTHATTVARSRPITTL
jgi:hypothetical protein